MKENMKAFIIGLGALLALLALLVTQYKDSGPASGGASPGVDASLSTSTRIAIGPQVNVQVFPERNGCAARIISTQVQPIMLTFGDDTGTGGISSTSLSQTIGHIQGASTTVVYDSGLYGCDRWFGYAAASTTITTIETR